MAETEGLAGRHVAVHVCGSIAAYRACDVITELRRRGAGTRVAMTEGAQHFITATTLQALSGHPVVTAITDSADGHGMGHLSIASWAEMNVVVAASANVIARLAHGFADDAVTAAVLASRAPLLVAPAMETAMWEHPATVANIETLRSRGAVIVGPVSGRLASGAQGMGRLSPLSAIIMAAEDAL